MAPPRKVGWLALPLVLVAVAAAAALALAELHFRSKVRFEGSTWPGAWDPRLGFTFKPGATVRQTNGVDFWAESRVNRWGFVDREPLGAKTSTSCRVAILGSSFVEAVQVELGERLQVVFEALARRTLPGRPIEAFALGYSGTGQVSQLPFYDALARTLEPDVVVLVLGPKDLANNSAVLTALRNGWHPDHLPRHSLQRDASGAFRWVAPDPDWRRYVLPQPPTETRAEARRSDAFLARSRLVSWTRAWLSVEHPTWFEPPAGPTSAETLALRRAAIEGLPGYGRVFDGWRALDDAEMDAVFATEGPLPAIFDEALAQTGAALDLFVERARRDRFTLLALTVDTVTSYRPTQLFGRKPTPDGVRGRVEALLAARSIPRIDQADYIASVHGRLEDAHFEHDGHWAPLGHRWAAEALASYFGAHPELCAARSSTAATGAIP
ncbi:MAG: hypothetical protein IT384_22280 [Deltaproteobacteria bacterium]|nr:hypothetical protein [Deltaproteobacteria bacterium]